MAKEGKETSEHTMANRNFVTIFGLILTALLAYAPQLIPSLPQKWGIIAGAIVGVLVVVRDTMLKLGYIKSRADVKVAEAKNGKDK